MKLDSVRLGVATSIVFAAIWAICSALVLLFPGTMMQLSGHMLHADLTGLGWSMHWRSFAFGLISWSLLPGLLVWAIAAVYNQLNGDD